MATRVFRKLPGFRNEEWVVPAGTLANDVVINEEDGRPGFALTSRGDATASVSQAGLTVSAFPVGGVGNKPTAATIAVAGYDVLVDVEGATEGETVAGDGTPQGTPVYAVVGAGGDVTSVTLTGDDNTLIGVVADGRIIGTLTPVSIGVGL